MEVFLETFQKEFRKRENFQKKSQNKKQKVRYNKLRLLFGGNRNSFIAAPFCIIRFVRLVITYKDLGLG